MPAATGTGPLDPQGFAAIRRSALAQKPRNTRGFSAVEALKRLQDKGFLALRNHGQIDWQRQNRAKSYTESYTVFKALYNIK